MLISIGESHAAKHQRIRVDRVAIYDPDRCGLRVLADGLGLEGLDPLFQTSRGDAMNIDKKLAHFVLQTGLLATFKSRPRDSYRSAKRLYAPVPKAAGGWGRKNNPDLWRIHV
jgi:hypothetical protein